MARRDTAYAAPIIATVSEPIVVPTEELEVEMVNHALCTSFNVTQGRHLRESGQWKSPELQDLLDKC